MSKSNATASASGGISFCGVLAILFIGLKLTDNIDWSWLWVLSPLWVPPAIIFTILVLVGVVAVAALAVAATADQLKKRKKR